MTQASVGDNLAVKLQETCRLDMRKHSFIKKVVTHWKGFPKEVSNAPRLSMFKRHWDNALNNAL